MGDAVKNRHRVGKRGRNTMPLRIAVAALIWLVCLQPATTGAQVADPGMAPGQEVAGTPDQPRSGPSPQGVLATRVEDVTVQDDGEATSIHVRGDGEFSYSTFRLSDPDRFVVDLPGVVNGLSGGYFSVGAAIVEQVRVAQFRGDPDPVMRVVIDLESQAIPSIETATDELIITFGAAPEMLAEAPVADSPQVDEELPALDEEPTTETTVAWQPVEDEAVEMGTPVLDPIEEEAVEMDTPALEPVVPEETSAPMEMASSETVDEPVPASSNSTEFLVEEAPELDGVAVEEPWIEPVVEVERAPIQVAQVESSDFETTSEVELYEAAQVEMDAPAPAMAEAEPGEIVNEPTIFRFTHHRWRCPGSISGEPMDLTLRDADIKDVLRSFARISGLNVVVQPGVTGKVTVELTQVPWDQALEQILKINGLGYELEGNIMRMCVDQRTAGKEAAEKREF